MNWFTEINISDTWINIFIFITIIVWLCCIAYIVYLAYKEVV